MQRPHDFGLIALCLFQIGQEYCHILGSCGLNTHCLFQIGDEYCIDLDSVHQSGISNGAMFSYIIVNKIDRYRETFFFIMKQKTYIKPVALFVSSLQHFTTSSPPPGGLESSDQKLISLTGKTKQKKTICFGKKKVK